MGSCATRTCPLGSQCAESEAGVECVEAPCGGVECPVGLACQVVEELVVDDDGAELTLRTGACLPDLCEDAQTCGAGQVCFAGECHPDACHLAACGPQARCQMVCVDSGEGGVECAPRCEADWLPAPPEEAEPDQMANGGTGDSTPVTEVAAPTGDGDSTDAPDPGDDSEDGEDIVGDGADEVDPGGEGDEGCFSSTVVATSAPIATLRSLVRR